MKNNFLQTIHYLSTIYNIVNYRNMPNKLTQDEFIRRANEKHGGKYDYSKVDYHGAETKVCIICPKHGEFWQTPHRHLMGDRCPMCSSRAKLNTEEFINRARAIHGDKYDYSKVQYVDNMTNVCIICPKHGEFWQRPSSHLIGQGCPVCGAISTGIKKRTNQDDFIKRANALHKRKYDYSKVQYISSLKPVTITCPLHGDFIQTPHKHLQGHGCPICGSKNNITEIRFFEELKAAFNNNVEYQKSFPFLKYGSGVQKIDFYLPEYNVGIELNGRQHYVPIDVWGGEAGFELTRKRDLIKYNKCKENGIKLFYFTPPSMKSYINGYFDTVYTSITKLIKDIKNL